ncbi:MAG: hypothetical protein HC906_17620 [Bacteroidales bacterium]|nr:hypothetical protein [Bacteroidales bacterium]
MGFPYFFSILSQLSRAIRWNMLIRPLGYNPKVYNSFLSVFVLYFVNLIAPRAGEIARCTVFIALRKNSVYTTCRYSVC